MIMSLNSYMRRTWSAAAFGLAWALVLTGCGSSLSTTGSSGPANSGAIRVVAGENMWGNMIEQIGGARVQVHSIISDPNTDPHEYESSAADASALASAQLVVVNGLGYDSFMDKLLAASPSSARKVVTVATVLSAGADANPHLWYETAKLAQVADAVEQELTAIDPAGAATFAQGAKTFSAALDPVLATIAQIKTHYFGAEIAYTERVPGYVVEAAGLQLGIPATFAQAIEDGNDPSPADVIAFRRALTDRTVKVLLYNAQVTSPATDELKTLAAANHIPVVGVTETLPVSDADFQSWQGRQAKELLAALGTSTG